METIHARTQCRPTAPVPLRDELTVTATLPLCSRRELAAGIQRAARHRQRYTGPFMPEPRADQLLPFHCAMLLADTLPTQGEIATDVKIARTIHHSRINAAKSVYRPGGKPPMLIQLASLNVGSIRTGYTAPASFTTTAKSKA